ncbi:MAG: hypothetical protein JJU06_03465 [Ectothiorhodospiraceae bacterium]|nr:hypothetical protein [Ectothiorhodospiraceae bacterium]
MPMQTTLKPHLSPERKSAAPEFAVVWLPTGGPATVAVETEQAAKALAESLGSSSAQSLSGVESARQALIRSPVAHLLIVYPNPERLLAEAMVSGIEPSEALQDWMAEADLLLALYRGHRRRISLIEAEKAVANPLALARALQERTGAHLSALPRFPSAQDTRAPDALLALIANQSLQQDSSARTLAAELEASSLLLSSGEPLTADPDQAFQLAMKAAEGTRNSVSEIASLQERLQYVEKALQDTRQQLEDAQKLEQDKESLMQQLKAELDEAREQAESSRSSGRDFEQDNELLLQQLHQVQEELETYFLDYTKLQSKMADAQSRLQEADAALKEKNKLIRKLDAQKRAHEQRAAEKAEELKRLRNSRSWKITRPLRGANIFAR